LNKPEDIKTKRDVVDHLLSHRSRHPVRENVNASAPANIALCKYWGKRNTELNLPVTDSLSLALGHLGSNISLSMGHKNDSVVLNDRELKPTDPFRVRTLDFLNLFRENQDEFHVVAQNTIPTAAGFASSASGFAALVFALDQLYQWDLDQRSLSILARLGSGSACRSVFEGLVIWHAGTSDDGMDSYAEPLGQQWPELRIGLIILSEEQKYIGSRAAMLRTVETSPLYQAWPDTVERDINEIQDAIADTNFSKVGRIAERNALTMHATMMASDPPIMYWLPDSLRTIKRVWNARDEGLDVFFTMDAGPNVKLLYEAHEQKHVLEYFPELVTTDG